MARNGAATRKSIMDAAQALILETGFSATSVDTVIARAGITKGAFFYHFRTKADLAEALVERDAAEDLHLLEEHLTQAEALTDDPLEQLLVCMDFYEQKMEALVTPYPGCLYASFIYEAQLFDDRTLGIVRRVFSVWRVRLTEKLKRIMERYPPRIPVSVETLADMNLAIAEGAFILSKVNHDPKAVAAQYRHYRNYLHLLFAPDPKAPLPSAARLQETKLDAVPAGS
ncbi:MAG TPA: TetR/AcrR family transcriptional regulator [Ferrovibrio sp.]|jgi:TetR/AcrR family transcriptional repressor of nem operon|uniref:TetR/AcrR family transcriptional regulator n=1 Tax=Ferrovibrio sp. TaxID=1917215 RepID=UPI002B4AE349|nr:TetR/AcrR family transcriptional regulator [Ferrovibrio sp.]HLT76005.1 TetR/AcrR family transcriptional regulator [Ferrovibrio sp.]